MGVCVSHPRSLTYSADGSCTIAGGLSRYVCIYAIAPRILLRKYQLSHNRSLDGVLDKLNSSHRVEGGDVDLSGSDDDKRCVSVCVRVFTSGPIRWCRPRHCVCV